MKVFRLVRSIISPLVIVGNSLVDILIQIRRISSKVYAVDKVYINERVYCYYRLYIISKLFTY